MNHEVKCPKAASQRFHICRIDVEKGFDLEVREYKGTAEIMVRDTRKVHGDFVSDVEGRMIFEKQGTNGVTLEEQIALIDFHKVMKGKSIGRIIGGLWILV